MKLPGCPWCGTQPDTETDIDVDEDEFGRFSACVSCTNVGCFATGPSSIRFDKREDAVNEAILIWYMRHKGGEK